MGCNPCAGDSTDYAALARAQGAANVDTAKVEGALNRPDINTPQGAQKWSSIADPSSPTGFRYQLDQTLQPAEQQKYDLGNQLALNSLYSGLQYGSPAIDKALSGDYSLPGAAVMGYDPQYGPTTNFQENSGAEYAPGLTDRLDYSGVAGIPRADNAMRDQIAGALYSQGARFLDPRFQQQQSQLDTKLSNQGIFSGSEANATEQQTLGDERTRAYGNLADTSIANAGTEMQNLFGMQAQQHQMGTGDVGTQANFANTARNQFINELLADQGARNAAIGNEFGAAATGTSMYNQGRAQNLQELAQNKTMPINVLNALLSGSQVNNPQFQPFNNNLQVAPAPVFQAGVAQGNASQANQQNWMNLAGSLGGTGMLKYSDRRLKSNVVRVGEKLGLPWYEFDIGGLREQGFMADEVEQKFPEAVITGYDGYKRVKYGLLGIDHG